MELLGGITVWQETSRKKPQAVRRKVKFINVVKSVPIAAVYIERTLSVVVIKVFFLQPITGR